MSTQICIYIIGLLLFFNVIFCLLGMVEDYSSSFSIFHSIRILSCMTRTSQKPQTCSFGRPENVETAIRSLDITGSFFSLYRPLCCAVGFCTLKVLEQLRHPAHSHGFGSHRRWKMMKGLGRVGVVRGSGRLDLSAFPNAIKQMAEYAEHIASPETTQMYSKLSNNNLLMFFSTSCAFIHQYSLFLCWGIDTQIQWKADENCRATGLHSTCFATDQPTVKLNMYYLSGHRYLRLFKRLSTMFCYLSILDNTTMIYPLSIIEFISLSFFILYIYIYICLLIFNLSFHTKTY